MAIPLWDSAQASLIIVDAVDRFRRTVTAEHKREIEKTAVKDVIAALVACSKTQQELNLRKLQHFVQAL